MEQLVKDGIIKNLCREYKNNNTIPVEAYDNQSVKRGLRNSDGTGVLAGVTKIGSVRGYVINDGDKEPMEGRLYYRGIDIRELVDGFSSEGRFGFEEVAYLLLIGKLPTADELEDFKSLLAEKVVLPENFTEDMIIKAPSRDIMNKLGRSTLALYSYDDNPDDISLDNVMRQCIELIARFPLIVAHAFQVKKHYYDHKSMHIHFPKPELSTAENFMRTIRSDKLYSEEDAHLLDLCLVLHAEHGGGNNSAFTCRVLSSAGTDTYSAISAAVGSLKGPLHGGANIKVCQMMDDIEANVSDWKNDDELAEYLRRIILKQAGDGSGKIYGMGHAIYTLSDPRAVILKRNAKALAEKKGMLERFELIESVERLTPQVFSAVKGDRKTMCANVDMYSGMVYRMLSIPPELFTAIFAIARITGWCAHRVEEITEDGRIIRPGYKSISVRENYLPISQRV